MTLKDIAAEAGVSVMTVSNVINGKHHKVSTSTVAKVNNIIKQYNYVPNLSARSLSVKSSGIVAIVISVSNNNSENYLENPFVSTMIGITEQLLRESGYYAMVRSVQKFEDVLNLLRNWNINGIIFLTPQYEEELQKQLDQIPCPVLIFDSNINQKEVINICSDDYGGTYLATKYLLNHGHKHIGFVADYQGNALLTRRFKGYETAMKDANLEIPTQYILQYQPSYEGGIEAGKQIAKMQGNITAVITTADICAIGIMEGARLSGYRIPADLSVIGFDNLKLCSYTTPKLTSISQQVTEKAEIGTKALIKKMNGIPCELTFKKMDIELVERQSVVPLT